MKAALLPDRGVVKVAGDDARKFLNGLITSDIGKVTPASAGFAALLTPQDKILFACCDSRADARFSAAKVAHDFSDWRIRYALAVLEAVAA